jgi:hypothetical protein
MNATLRVRYSPSLIAVGCSYALSFLFAVEMAFLIVSGCVDTKPEPFENGKNECHDQLAESSLRGTMVPLPANLRMCI